jgi:alanyl-tRNA synthetase
MQYNRDEAGVMHPLPKPSVDTGMGLERLAAIMQQVHNNYDIDLFKHLIKTASELTDTEDQENKSLRVIADHIRSCAFLIVDGVLPSNEGRGYVLRRIIRRAARHGHQLGCKEPFFYRLVSSLDEIMGDAYPELRKHKVHVARVLEKEEQRFAETLEQGMRILEENIAQMKGKTISGEVVFKLYDTYGFPVDLTADVARERGLAIDEAGFDQQMEIQKTRARASSQFGVGGEQFNLDELESTQFNGYDESCAQTRVISIMQDGESCDEIENQQEAIVVLEQSPFYAESGGQVGDIGFITNADTEFQVRDTQKQNDVFMHIGAIRRGKLTVGDTVTAQIDEEHRLAVMLNHSATHLMHAALRQILGDHVHQKGSLVDADKLRFDFSHYQPLSTDEIEQIEILVNDQIRMNLPTSAELMDMDAARETGAMALFGEKYGETVRVLRIGSESVELCGGTHVRLAGDIGLFKITVETGIAAGVRRIEALTGKAAMRRFIDSEHRLEAAAQVVKSSRDDLLSRIEQLYANNRNLEKELSALKSRAATEVGGDLATQAVDVKGIKVLAASIDGADIKTLRDTVDQLKNKLGCAAIVLASSDKGKVSIIAGVTKAETDRIRAGDLVNVVAGPCGGRGGGRADMAQAGGNAPEKLNEALALVAPWVESQL